MQAALKKKEQKRHAKKKRAQEKSQREEEVVVRRQGAAVEGLSDREKRALAAEKRLALKNINDSSIQRYIQWNSSKQDLYVRPDLITLWTQHVPSVELVCAAVVGVVWQAWFHSTDSNISTVQWHVYMNTELNWRLNVDMRCMSIKYHCASFFVMAHGSKVNMHAAAHRLHNQKSNPNSVLTSTLNPVFLPLSKQWVGVVSAPDPFLCKGGGALHFCAKV